MLGPSRVPRHCYGVDTPVQARAGDEKGRAGLDRPGNCSQTRFGFVCFPEVHFGCGTNHQLRLHHGH